MNKKYSVSDYKEMLNLFMAENITKNITLGTIGEIICKSNS